MSNNTKEILHTFRTTCGAPLDTRYTLSSISNMSTELLDGVRYEGLCVYVIDEQEYFVFVGGILESNFVPLSSLINKSIATRSDVSEISTNSRYVGKEVFVIDECCKYIFATGITDDDFIKLSNIDTLVSDTINTTSNTFADTVYIAQSEYILYHYLASSNISVQFTNSLNESVNLAYSIRDTNSIVILPLESQYGVYQITIKYLG